MRPKVDLILTRVFECSAEHLFNCWSDAKRVQRWWGPKHFTSPFCEIDFRVGGRYLFCMRSPQGEEYWSSGIYEVIEFPRSIVARDCYSDARGNILSPSSAGLPSTWPSTLLLRLSFEPMDANATRLHLSHGAMPPELEQSCREGWNEALDKLTVVVSSSVDVG
jgi:uncharacterized protein YndB with AHSA1/START domain